MYNYFERIARMANGPVGADARIAQLATIIVPLVGAATFAELALAQAVVPCIPLLALLLDVLPVLRP